MALPDLPDDPDRGQLVTTVAWLMRGDHTEAEADHVIGYLDRKLPDPEWMDIIYWPGRHERTARRGVSDPTPDQVVAIAFEYEPFAL